MASDFHTHTPHPGRTELVDGGEGRAPLWSLPFHPWHTVKIPVVPEEKLRSCAALGELGFDKFRGAAPWPGRCTPPPSSCRQTFSTRC